MNCAIAREMTSSITFLDILLLPRAMIFHCCLVQWFVQWYLRHSMLPRAMINDLCNDDLRYSVVASCNELCNENQISLCNDLCNKCHALCNKCHACVKICAYNLLLPWYLNILQIPCVMICAINIIYCCLDIYRFHCCLVRWVVLIVALIFLPKNILRKMSHKYQGNFFDEVSCENYKSCLTKIVQ